MQVSDNNVEKFDGENVYELSAQLGYSIDDKTKLFVRAGYIDVEWEDDPTIGAGVSLHVWF